MRIVLARSLTPYEYGLFFAVFIFISFFDLFRDFGLNPALVKYIPEFNVKKRNDLIKSSIVTSMFIQFVSAVIIIIVLFFLSDYLAISYFKSPRASLILKILSLILVLNIFDDTLKKVSHGFHKMHLFSFIELSRNLFVLIFVILFLSLGMKVLSPTYAYTLAPILTFLIFVPIVIRLFPFIKTKLVLTKELIKKLFLFGIPSILAVVGDKIMAFSDVLILTYFVTLDQVGIYNVVLPTAFLLLFFGRAIALVMMPLSSELWAKKEYLKLSDGLNRLHKYTLIIIIPVALALIAFSNLYISVIFGKEYIGGTLALQLILIGVIFFSLAKVNNAVIQNIGKPKIVATIMGLAAIANIIINIILIPIYGIVGAAIATSLTYILAWVLSNHQTKKLIKTKIPWKNTIKIFISGLIFISLIFYIKKLLTINVYLEFIITLGIAAIIYFFLIFLLKVITIKEIKDLVKASTN